MLPNQTAPPRTQPPTEGELIEEAIVELERSYDKASPCYKFVYIFYDMLDRDMPRVEKPARVAQDIWDLAVRQNPLPDHQTPAIVYGYDELEARLEKQRHVMAKLGSSRKYLADKANELIEMGTLKLANKISIIATKYQSLLVSLLEKLASLLGSDAGAVSLQYEHLEKRIAILNENITAFTEMVMRNKKSFKREKAKETHRILEEQRTLLHGIVGALENKVRPPERK